MKMNTTKIAHVAELRNLWAESTRETAHATRVRFEKGLATLNNAERETFDAWAKDEDARYQARFNARR